ncbi:hypothetical protein J6590_039251 [Homalodisca vitripennis]|nr:hypothetical protein J6590_039251 [Homalodisca vitripennis]
MAHLSCSQDRGEYFHNNCPTGCASRLYSGTGTPLSTHDLKPCVHTPRHTPHSEPILPPIT